MRKILKKQKGITLITLVVAVSIMIIISSMLIYNAKTGIKMRNLKMMQNDIDLLDNKVDAYYVKYGALPIEIEYNVTPLSFENEKSPNDNDKYYILDLKAFEGLTLNYGADFASVTAGNVSEYTDIYVINEQSHHIYYVRGIEMDGTTYHTNDKEQKITLNEEKWIKAVSSYSEGELYGLDNWGNLYSFDETYFGSIKENENYIKADELFEKHSDLKGKNIIQISAGDCHTVAIDERGKVYTWGENYYGQLGDGTANNSNVPICISDISGNILNGKKIVQISAGDGHTTAIDKEGKVYVWGYNGYGQLGDGTTNNSNVPICISDIEENSLQGKIITKLSAGNLYTIAIDNEGKSILVEIIEKEN